MNNNPPKYSPQPYPMMIPMMFPQMPFQNGQPPQIQNFPFGAYNQTQPLQQQLHQNSNYNQNPNSPISPNKAFLLNTAETQSIDVPQTEEEVLKNFRRKILPQLTLKRLKKLQALIKGAYVRKRVIPKKKLWHSIIEDYSQRKLVEFIEDSIIPDIALEVLTQNMQTRDLTLYSTELRGDIEYVDEMVLKVVTTLARESVTEVIDSFVSRYKKD